MYVVGEAKEDTPPEHGPDTDQTERYVNSLEE
jgi:hypothetical protein